MSRQGEIRAKCCVRARFSLRLSDAEAPKNAKRILVAGLECGDLEARRAGEMTAWDGAKRSPQECKKNSRSRLGMRRSGSPKGRRDDSLGWSEAEPQEP